MNLSLGRTLSTVALASGLAVATVATAGNASAEDLVVKDAQSDMLSYDVETDTTAPAPEVTDADILRTVLHHNARRVAVRVKYTDLRRRGQVFSHGLQVVTNEGVRREVSIYAGPHMWRGDAMMTRPNGNPVDCAIKHGINYDTNVVTLSFSRTCISRPRWVRLGVGSVWVDADGNVYGDDGQLDGRMRDAGLKFSPRLRRA